MSKQLLISFTLICCGSFLLPQQSIAAELMLISKPAKCVSLKQGRTCYQDVTFRWQAPAVADYCIFKRDIEKPLKCWSRKRQGKLGYAFADRQNQHFILRKRGQEIPLATTVIEVRWVYKRRNERFGWKIF